jgi:hypothetical protein
VGWAVTNGYLDSNDLEIYRPIVISPAPVASVLQTRVERHFDQPLHLFAYLNIPQAATVKMESSFITSCELNISPFTSLEHVVSALLSSS